MKADNGLPAVLFDDRCLVLTGCLLAHSEWIG